MRNKVVKKILISIIISIMLINLICVNFGEVFATYGNPSSNDTPYAPGFRQDDLDNDMLPEPPQTPDDEPQDEPEPEEEESEVESPSTPAPDEEEDMGNVKISNIIKDTVAKWYYIMRLIVIAFMLILLIFIGIKMAISTIASEKAVYKQMLVDWVAGMIIVFSIHYIMIFILTVNDNIVAALNDFIQNQSTTIQAESEYGAEENEKSSSELETTLYESARTRAYSLKMTDGFTGMIIYGVLVYYAWRYTLMYFRRVINIIILTLLAPAVSASYAFNKVISGKAKIFSTWLSEFIMTVAVQTVHAILYVSFVSTALVLSLQSLPGVILAIILLNFMTKADKILRGIFRLSGGSGSLAGDMTDKSTFGELKKEVQGIANVMVGGAVTKQAAKLTYRVATKPVRAVAEKKFGDLMEATANDPEYIAAQEAKEKKAGAEAEAAYLNYRKTIGLDEKEEKINAEVEELKKRLSAAKKAKDANEIEKIIQQSQENIKKQEQLEDEETQAQDEFFKAYHASGTEKETLKDGIYTLFSPESYTREITKSEINRYKKLKALKEENFEEFQKQYRNGEITRADKKMLKDFQKLEADGKLKEGYRRKISTRRSKDEEYAPWRRLMGGKTDGVGKRFVENMKLKNLLGLSSDEEKVLKDKTKFYKQSIMGVISGIAGWATIGSNFTLGIGLLATSAAAKGEMRKRAGYSYNRPKYKRQGSYRFKAFSKGTEETIYEEAMKQIQFAESQMTRKNAENHPELAYKIMNATKVVVKPVFVAGIAVSGVCLGVPLQGRRAPMSATSGVRLRPSLTFIEDDKLAAIHDKKLRDDFKDFKKKFANMNSQTFKKDFDEKFEKYKEELAEQAKTKGKNSLLVQEALARENTVVVSDGATKVVVQIKDDNEISKLVETADKIDFRDDLSRREKLSKIKDAIAQNETALIEEAISRVCAAKGIYDLANFELTDANSIRIQKEILGSLEKRGLIQKGEIVLDDKLVSKETIASVYENLIKNDASRDLANSKVNEKIVQDAILKYIEKNAITDGKKLKNDSAKAEIYDIIKERLMSEDSKKSAAVTEKLSGRNLVKEQTELSDEIKTLVDEMSDKVKKQNLLKTDEEKSEKSKELLKKLVERETTRKVNETKERLEEGLYTGGENIDDEKELEMLFTLAEIGRQNKEAEKAGDKSAREERKKQTAAELDYYLQKEASKEWDPSMDGSKNFDSSRDGSKRFDTNKDGSKRADDENDGNRDVSKIIKDLETKLHGPHDVVAFLNKVRR